MGKIVITVTDEMEKAFRDLAIKENKPVSYLGREGLEYVLAQRGLKVKSKLEWGGVRPKQAKP